MNKVRLAQDGTLLCPKNARKTLMAKCLICTDNHGQGMDDRGQFFWCKFAVIPAIGDVKNRW